MHNSVEGSKRQLPPWMVQKVGASHVSNSDNVVETNCRMEKGDIMANAGNAKKIAGVDHMRETSKRKSNLNEKCELKRRRNLSQRDGNGNNIIQKKKKKGARCRDRVQKSSTKKGQNLRDPSHGSCDVNPVQVSSDDDVELTIEDLMAIAEQYVKDYENKERHETSGTSQTGHPAQDMLDLLLGPLLRKLPEKEEN